MAKDTPKKPELVFEDVQPTNRAHSGADCVRVDKGGLRMSTAASKRWLDVNTMSVKISPDGTAIKLSQPGAFRPTKRRGGGGVSQKTAAPIVTINTIAIPAKAKMGTFLHQGDEVYILDGKGV